MTGGAQVSQVVGDTVGGAAPGEQVHAEETLPTRSAGGNARGGRSCPAELRTGIYKTRATQI